MMNAPGPEPSDDELVRGFQRDTDGESGRAAAAALVARWRGRAYLWAFRVLREREAALDAAQDALLQMYTALPRYESRGRFSAWLFTIVHNRCLLALRKRPLVREDEAEVDDLEMDRSDPGDRVETSLELERVLEAMNRHLEPVERRALWLKSYEGMSVNDITRLLRIEGPSGARAVIQTARRKLRLALAERKPQEGAS